MMNEASITMNISLPEPLKRYVDDKVATGIYGSASEFVREAIREKLQREQELRDAKDALAAKLLEGLDSGKPIPFDENYAARKKSSLMARLGRKHGKS
jgi:antitoxin ParD1/3/4